MRRAIGLLLLILALLPARIALGQTALDRLTPPLPTAAERHAADVVSWATAIATVALDTRVSFEAPDRTRALEREGLRVGLVYGSAFLIKQLVHRQRPCAPDCGRDNPDFSFYSAHTAIAFSTIGGPRLAFVLPLAIGTGGLRIAAGKHFLTDVLAGAGVGWLTSRIR